MSAKFIVIVSLVIEKNGKVLLVRRTLSKDHAPGEWETVSGRVEYSETPVEAARREALEETGLMVEVLEPLDTFHFYRGTAREEAIGMTFHCRVEGGELRLSEEHTASAWVSRIEAQQYNLPEGLLRCIDGILESGAIRNK
jgi:8-oxo-dGTP diphosphatase